MHRSTSIDLRQSFKYCQGAKQCICTTMQLTDHRERLLMNADRHFGVYYEIQA